MARASRHGLSRPFRRGRRARSKMIKGMVKGKDFVIPLAIRRRGRTLDLEAVIDTGFTGWLTLPSRVVESLDLRWFNLGRAVLADGSICLHDVYLARIVWHGRLRQVRVNALDGIPLVGVS